MDFIGGKDDGGGGGHWSCMEECKASVKSSPTNQHPAFYRPDDVSHPTNSVKALKGKWITFHGLAHLKLTWDIINIPLETFHNMSA